MKNSTGKIFLVFCCTFIVLCSNCFGQISEVWVSPTGSDSNIGTKEQPLASPSMALRKVRELRRLHQTDPSKSVHIYLSSGKYFLEEPIHIRPEDSGISNNPTILEAAPQAQHEAINEAVFCLMTSKYSDSLISIRLTFSICSNSPSLICCTASETIFNKANSLLFTDRFCRGSLCI